MLILVTFIFKIDSFTITIFRTQVPEVSILALAKEVHICYRLQMESDDVSNFLTDTNQFKNQEGARDHY